MITDILPSIAFMFYHSLCRNYFPRLTDETRLYLQSSKDVYVKNYIYLFLKRFLFDCFVIFLELTPRRIEMRNLL